MPPFHHENDQNTTQPCLNLMIQLPNATPHPTTSHLTPPSSSHWLLCLKMTIQRTNLTCRCSELHAPFPPRKRPKNRPILLNRHDSTPQHYPTPIHFKSSTSFMCSWLLGSRKTSQRTAITHRCRCSRTPPPAEKKPKHHPILFDCCRNSTPQSHPTPTH